MNKRTILVFAFAIFVWLRPGISHAADVYFDNALVEDTSSHESCITSSTASSNCEDRWTLRTVNALNSDFYITYLKEDGSIAQIDFSDATFTFDQFLGENSIATPLVIGFNNKVIQVSPENSLFAEEDELKINIEEATSNEIIGTTIYPAVTTVDPSTATLNDWTLGNALAVGNYTDTENETLTNAVSSLSVSSSSTIIGKSATYTYTVSLNRTVNASEVINFFFSKVGVQGPNEGFDFSQTTYEIEGSIGEVDTSTASYLGDISLASDLSEGLHELTLFNIVNPNSEGVYMAMVSTETITQGANVTASDEFTITEAVSKPNKPIKLKVKKITARGAILKWRAVDDADFYKVNLRSNKGKKIKLFKNITVAKKKLTKKILSAGKKYKFRVRACNVAGCSKWSKHKSFQTNLRAAKF